MSVKRPDLSMIYVLAKAVHMQSNTHPAWHSAAEGLHYVLDMREELAW